ncbi:hypothetical protein G6F37_011463 [Rhizopus arrhizus]|nr:hypothetical protein G6F38_012012 [Rhizopus arrhizus]KAG1149196.1 hypothetical protein G6F37_011463 [Rhizopus arrhizus]
MVLSPNEFTGTLSPDDVSLTTLTTTSASSTAENDTSNDPHLTQASILSPISTSSNRKEIPIFQSFQELDMSNDQPVAIPKRGTWQHSAFYRIQHHLKHFKVQFSTELRKVLPFGVGLGSKEACDKATNTPLEVNGHKFPAFPAVDSQQALLKVNLSKLPLLPVKELRELLINNFSRYGTVRDIVIYLDDWSQTWFSGNDCIYLERPSTTEKTFDTLQYKIDLDNNGFCLGTWGNMKRHCIYCKAMGHSRKDCPELPAETRTCYVCNSRGHIARNCPKTDENDQSSSKRARGTQSVGTTPIVISRKSKKRGRQPAATPMLASTTPAPLIIEVEPSAPPSTQNSSASISTTEVDLFSTSFSPHTDNSGTQVDEDDNDRMDTDTNPDATEQEGEDNAVLSSPKDSTTSNDNVPEPNAPKATSKNGTHNTPAERRVSSRSTKGQTEPKFSNSRYSTLNNTNNSTSTGQGMKLGQGGPSTPSH